MTMTVVTATIPANGSLSTAVQIPDAIELRRIVMPAAWSSAGLSFQVSLDNVTYNDLFDAKGLELNYPVQPGTAVVVDVKNRMTGTWVRLRSGTRDHPVNQSAIRAFTLGLAPK